MYHELRPMFVYEEAGVICGYYSLALQDNGAVHLGTHKFEFFSFTCGCMRKEV